MQFSWDHCLWIIENILLTVFNEFVKVKYDPKPVLLDERLSRKQQQWKLEIFQVSEGSCVVSVMIMFYYVKNAVHTTVSYNGSCHQCMHIVYSKLYKSVLLFDIIFLILCVLHGSIALYNFFCQIDKTMCHWLHTL